MGKKNAITMLFVVAVVALAGGQAKALYIVDVGTPASEAGYSPASWGPIQPDTSGGNWGGIAADILSSDGKCRVIWDASDDDPAASLAFPASVTSVAVRHLLGAADDSFDVDVSGSAWGSVSDAPSSSEVWTATTFSGVPGRNLTLTATGEKWPSFNTYGQVAIDWVAATQTGETFQVWTFDDENPSAPELDLNIYGEPTAVINSAAGPPEWAATFLERDGVWQADGITVELDIPNQMIPNPYKEIDIEIGFIGDLANFSVFPTPFSPTELVGQEWEVVDTATGWKRLTAKWLIYPNPESEAICYAFSGDAALDYVAVRTICVPEPLTICLLGLGGLILRTQKRKPA